MIDLEKAKQEFLEYVSTFDKTEYNINKKKNHSIRVMEISNKLAKTIFNTEEEIELATLIGLLHDIARFYQYTTYRTFREIDSIDHGDYGVKILQENNYIRKYIQTDKYDNLIFKAIKNHNKFKIEEGLTQEELTYARLIRDADKLDIFYEACEIFYKDNKQGVENSKISKDIEEKIKNKEVIVKETKIEYKDIDKVLIIVAFIFDLNYKESFKITKENEYINRMIEQFDFKNKETKEKIEEIRKMINEYIEEKAQ